MASGVCVCVWGGCMDTPDVGREDLGRIENHGREAGGDAALPQHDERRAQPPQVRSPCYNTPQAQ